MADLLNLHQEVRSATEAVTGVLRRHGYRVEITSAFRDLGKQTSLYRAWLRGERALPVAPPGESTHNYGFAVDVISDAPMEVLVDLMAQVGMRWAGRKDPVHFDPFGPALWRRILSGR